MSDRIPPWNPTVAGQEVRLRANPGQRGITTGKVQQVGSKLLVQIQFGPNEKSYKPYNLLEPCHQPEDIPTLLRLGRFGGADDLRRILTCEKVQGHLTNVFYSMETSNTDFFPHQFKPVLKFLESPTGRLLIADEVGLGKTIEAMFVWKELQARADARRLLIVCPAVLRDKWKDDLRNRFNIIAEMTDAQGLLNKVQGVLGTDAYYPFVCIASLEGLRPSVNWEDENVTGARAELARLLDRNSASSEFGIFDLVVIDEAHYLRNPSTANHRIGQLLRDAARHLLLLTATPIQIHSTNLYQLLRLISPEDFFDPLIFQDMLSANMPVVNALRLIWSNPPNIHQAKRELMQALRSPYFAKNPILQQVEQSLNTPEAITPETRVQLGYKLESASLLGQYMTRSRKRDVLPQRVERAPQTLTVSFSPLEQEIYQIVTQRIRQQAKDAQGVSLFRLIARQRQMTSCMVAALQAWSKQGILHDLLHEDEQLWEDFGLLSDAKEAVESLAESAILKQKIDVVALEQQDTKYRALIQFLRRELSQSSEKFVLFAYFRGTLHYLQRRLQADGIQTCLIIGDMGESKWDVIRDFRDGSASVLLSSEVGSEGIDLQFCRFLINYDLPWNPMRVEQRIGRLDRLGQKAERISIINFSLVDTVEERILERLYDRIQIFQESIGDLEEILGEMTDQLLTTLFEANLTADERQQKADEAATTILKRRFEQQRLENEAINMLAFSDFILNAIDRSRSQGRWLHPDELEAFVEDYFARYYPGTTIESISDTDHAFNISLAEAAKTDLEEFVRQHRFATSTALSRLSNQAVLCFFDPKKAMSSMGREGGKRGELLDPTHPLIQWISQNYKTEAQKFHSTSAITLSQQFLSAKLLNISVGVYVYTIHRWSFKGLRSENRLAYKVARCTDGSLLTDECSEQLINDAARYGNAKINAVNLVPDLERVLSVFAYCNEILEEEFGQAAGEFDVENASRCEVQQKSAEKHARRRQDELQERLERFHSEGKLQIIPATEGLLRKVNRELELKLRSIAQKRETSLDLVQLAAGILFIE